MTAISSPANPVSIRRSMSIHHTAPKRSLIVDTDMGFDDVLALLLLHASKSCGDVRLVSTVLGINSATYGAHCARGLLGPSINSGGQRPRRHLFQQSSMASLVPQANLQYLIIDCSLQRYEPKIRGVHNHCSWECSIFIRGK